MGFFDEEWVLMPRVEEHNCFEWKGSPFHIVPEAVEYDPTGAPGIRVCKHCQRGWCTPRGDPVCEPPSPDNTGLGGARLLGHDDLYWQVRVPCGSERCLRGMLINGPVVRRLTSIAGSSW